MSVLGLNKVKQWWAEVTGRSELQSQLEALSAAYNSIKGRYTELTNNLAASVIIREPTGHVSYCSPYTLVLTGYSLVEIHSEERDFFETIIHPEDLDAYSKAMRITHLGEAFQVRYRILHKTGIQMWVETRTVPILDEQGEISGILAITFDVTASVRYQRQIEERNRDLQDLTYTISHDLRSPIVTINGMAAALEQEIRSGTPENSLELLEHIKKANGTLERLTTAILTFFKMAGDEIAWQRVDVREVLDEVLASHTVQIQQTGAQISLEGNAVLVSDRTMMYQILSNLVGNALKYRASNRSPVITVCCEEQKLGRSFLLAVKDNGAGIASEKLETLFRPFKRGESAQEPGFGIGLATVKKLVQKLGGNIAVESEVGNGSTFSITLPAQL